jgi:hypothetical protein
MAFKEAITWFGALDHATGCRVDAETVPMRAYVTSGNPPLVDDAREAPCERATASRHVGWRAQGSRHTSGAKAFVHAPPVGGDLGVGLRGTAGDACASLQTPRLLRWQRSRQRVARWSPSERRGRAKQTARARTVAPLPLP